MSNISFDESEVVSPSLPHTEGCQQRGVGQRLVINVFTREVDGEVFIPHPSRTALCIKALTGSDRT
jgi:hypothetical protein